MNYFEVYIGLIFWVPLSFSLNCTVIRKWSLDDWNSFKFVKLRFIAQQINNISCTFEKKIGSLVLKYNIQYDVCFVVQLLSCVWLFATAGTAACQASLSFTISRSLLKLMSIETVMPFNHLLLCCPLLLLKLFQKLQREEHSQTLYMRPRSPW